MKAQEFGAKVRELRQQAGMIQRELADKVGIDFTYLSKIESGVMPPPSEKVISKLAEALGVDKDNLIILAGKIPSDIAQVLKNGETLQRLRSEHARKMTRSSDKKESVHIIKQLKSFPKIAVAVVLVLAIASSLWFASPVKALDIAVTPTATGNLNASYPFTVTVSIEDAELLPIQSIDLKVYKSDAPSTYDLVTGLPLSSTTGQYVHFSTANSGAAYIKAVTESNWGRSYGYGYAVWQGYGYTWPLGYGYGYQDGTGTTWVRYDVIWMIAAGWPSGNYKVEAEITANGVTFTETSAAFTLSAAVSAPEEVWVDDDALVSWYDATHFVAIQHGINVVESGGTVTVLAGTYSGNITINKSLTLKSTTGSANSTISANVSGYAVAIVTDNAILGVLDYGFTITNAGGSGILLNASSCTIDSNRVTSNAADGIRVIGSSNRIRRNLITSNGRYGIYLPGISGWNEVGYNNITGNATYGAYADPVPGNLYWMQSAGFNYWGDVSGPGGVGPGTGDSVNAYVWYNPWLNTSYSTILASGIADISMGIPLEVGWNTLSTPLALAGDSNNWDEIVTSSGLTYTAACVYDAATETFVNLPTNSTTVLDPLDAVFIRMSAANIAHKDVVTLKVSTEIHAPPTKDLEAGWNFIGASMSITDRELEMWQVLISVESTSAGLIGYDIVVSPPLATQPPWVYVRGQEDVSGFEWQKMDFGRGYWIYMENADEFAGFGSTPITARVWN